MGVNVSRSADITVSKEVGDVYQWHIVAYEYARHGVTQTMESKLSQPILLDDIAEMLCYIRWPNQSAELVYAHII